MLVGHIKQRSGGSMWGNVMGVLCWLVGLWSSLWVEEEWACV